MVLYTRYAYNITKTVKVIQSNGGKYIIIAIQANTSLQALKLIGDKFVEGTNP